MVDIYEFETSTEMILNEQPQIATEISARVNNADIDVPVHVGIK